MGTAIAHIEVCAHITTLDYNGEPQTSGGDPVAAEVLDDKGDKLPIELKDNGDGSYDVRFTPHRPSTYCLKVRNRGRQAAIRRRKDKGKISNILFRCFCC